MSFPDSSGCGVKSANDSISLIDNQAKRPIPSRQMIPQEFIDDIQSRTDIAELISSYIPLKRSGRNFKALCPFHGEKTPSFMVSPQKQIFHCFGCGEGGGALQFITLIEKVSFPEAVEIAAKRLGVEVPQQRGQSQELKPRLYEAMQEASLFFHRNLKELDAAAGVSQYLKQRGIGQKTIASFRLGLAQGQNSLMDYLRGKGFTLELLEKASLVTALRQGYRDLFRERIMFPIFDARAKVVGFGGRLYTEAKDAPKYINSLENAVYSKRAHLFGLHLAKETIAASAEAIVVEGYLDMITPFMRGAKNIVASLGTALTYEQIRLLKRYAPQVVLVFDSDTAGQNATMRTIDLLLECDMGVSIATLPQGMDPDSLVRQKGIEAFSDCLAKKLGFFDYKLSCLSHSHDVRSIEGKTAVAESMLSTIDKLASEIKKYEYIKSLAAHLQISEEILIAEFRKKFQGSRRARGAHAFAAPEENIRAQSLSQEPVPITEKIILKFMCTNQKAFQLVHDNLQPEDFRHPLSRQTVTVLFSSHSGQSSQSVSQRLAAVQEREVCGFISQLLMEEDKPGAKNLFKESILKLKKHRLIQVKHKLKSMIQEAEASGDKEKVKQLIDEFTRTQ